MGEDLGQISPFPGDGLSAIGEDLGPFAERVLPVVLTTARAFIDRQIENASRTGDSQPRVDTRSGSLNNSRRLNAVVHVSSGLVDFDQRTLGFEWLAFK